jgi:hypothetical protein
VALLAFHLLVTRRIKIDEGRKALIAAVNLPFPAEQEVVRKFCHRFASRTGQNRPHRARHRPAGDAEM